MYHQLSVYHNYLLTIIKYFLINLCFEHCYISTTIYFTTNSTIFRPLLLKFQLIQDSKSVFLKLSLLVISCLNFFVVNQSIPVDCKQCLRCCISLRPKQLVFIRMRFRNRSYIALDPHATQVFNLKIQYNNTNNSDQQTICV